MNSRYALITGVTGMVANVLLILFFALAQPWHEVPTRFDWLGPANDVVIVVQLATLIPVALALRTVKVAKVVGVAAMVAGVLLQLLLIFGVMDFDVQGPLVTACYLVMFIWIFVVSRFGGLPRMVARFGTAVGLGLPIGLAVVALGFAVQSGSLLQYAAFAVGGLIGLFGWLGMPVWPLLLARKVFISEGGEGNEVVL